MLRYAVPPSQHRAGSASVQQRCPGCGEAREEQTLIHCVTCGASVCPGCCRGVYPSRNSIGICKQCPLPHKMMAVHQTPTFRCGRCFENFTAFTGRLSSQRGDTPAYFCRNCCAPICVYCMPSSFEAGYLYCAQCCRDRVCWQAGCVRQFIDERLVEELYSGAASPAISSLAPTRLPARAAPVTTKYRELTGKTLIGKGAQATVFKCQTADGELVVSKEMTFTSTSAFHAQVAQAERMKQLSHTHLIRYLDVISDPAARTVHIILPYYSKGDLKQLIFNHRGAVPVFKLCSLILQLTTALCYLHHQTPALVHGDVKPENVLLLNNEEQVLLMDLDLCGEEDGASATRRQTGRGEDRAYTCEYSAPEVRLGQRRTPKADIFSLGVVTYALAALPSEIFLMYRGDVLLLSDQAWEKDFSALSRLIRTAIQRRCSKYPPELLDLIMDMLRYRPEDRPTSGEVERRLSDIMMTVCPLPQRSVYRKSKDSDQVPGSMASAALPRLCWTPTLWNGVDLSREQKDWGKKKENNNNKNITQQQLTQHSRGKHCMRDDTEHFNALD
eukprot:gene2329-1464_t